MNCTRILHEAFYYERCKHGIFGSIFEIWTSMYSSTISPKITKLNFALRARIFHPSITLVTKFHAICGLHSVCVTHRDMPAGDV